MGHVERFRYGEEAHLCTLDEQALTLYLAQTPVCVVPLEGVAALCDVIDEALQRRLDQDGRLITEERVHDVFVRIAFDGIHYQYGLREEAGLELMLEPLAAADLVSCLDLYLQTTPIGREAVADPQGEVITLQRVRVGDD